MVSDVSLELCQGEGKGPVAGWDRVTGMGPGLPARGDRAKSPMGVLYDWTQTGVQDNSNCNPGKLKRVGHVERSLPVAHPLPCSSTRCSIYVGNQVNGVVYCIHVRIHRCLYPKVHIEGITNCRAAKYRGYMPGGRV